MGLCAKPSLHRGPSRALRPSGRDRERLEIETKDGQIVIRRALPHFSLQELFRGKSPEEWRAAYAGAFGWGRMSAVKFIEE
jgi:hypothetical protein